MKKSGVDWLVDFVKTYYQDTTGLVLPIGVVEHAAAMEAVLLEQEYNRGINDAESAKYQEIINELRILAGE